MPVSHPAVTLERMLRSGHFACSFSFGVTQNFGGNYVSTKNAHGTFTFKMQFHNDVSLTDYPLTYEELLIYKLFLMMKRAQI